MSGGELERRTLDGRVVDGDQLADDQAADEVAAELADMGKLLAVAAYGGMDHGRRLIAGNQALWALHSPREPETDFRCATCRTSRGKPAPWPCETLVTVLEAMGMPITLDVEALRDWGRVRNGGKPHTDALHRLVARAHAEAEAEGDQ